MSHHSIILTYGVKTNLVGDRADVYVVMWRFMQRLLCSHLLDICRTLDCATFVFFCLCCFLGTFCPLLNSYVLDYDTTTVLAYFCANCTKKSVCEKVRKETLDINVFTGGGKLINELIKLSSLIIYTSNYFVILNFRKQMTLIVIVRFLSPRLQLI